MVNKFSVIDWGEPNTTARSVPENSLTLEKLQAAMRLIRDIPPPPRIDLYPQDVDPEKCFQINRSRVGSFIDREMWIVPRKQLINIYRQMKNAGIDVILEPRYGRGDEHG